MKFLTMRMHCRYWQLDYLVYSSAIDSETAVTAPVKLEDHALIGAAPCPGSPWARALRWGPLLRPCLEHSCQVRLHPLYQAPTSSQMHLQLGNSFCLPPDMYGMTLQHICKQPV